ncbi:phosphoenolpyruvate--protein phosphotransferase [Antrihabitans sp. YC2-6]|uniref:phosphoenolpyruvate--protein phosphotransferase n=1 Tax=Antrihabitans sp. YC2-6 TaxID=2799498 RepID=UPI0018F5CB1A|nr:phosphoenolpyruvate--protein phosphotransferase [Antrihabitans sp. YC2-6]MBJ8347125.1 phosphoenolpyruvate--protein phosphotransferase [Antrihabitans sp. YC2-6]
MIGIVVVSYNGALAGAAVSFAHRIVPKARIELAARLDDDAAGLDPTQVAAAIARADDGAGVVVLVDPDIADTSAVLEFLADEVRERVTLCRALLVEGLIAGVITAAGGGNRDEVAAGALEGLVGKHLELVRRSLPELSNATETDYCAAHFTVTDPHGLHARPAARLVAAAGQFDAVVNVRNATTASGWVSAGSLTKVVTLGVRSGHVVEVRASGVQADDAVTAVAALHSNAPLASNFPKARTVGLSRGVAIGPAWTADDSFGPVPEESQGADEELRRLESAIATVTDVVLHDRRTAADRIGEGAAQIFDVHAALLTDPELLDGARARILAGENAIHAWSTEIERVTAAFGYVTDQYIRERAADVRAVGAQVRHALSGTVAPSIIGASGILIAGDLTPAQVLELNPDRVSGVVLAAGSSTSHTAVLLRANGIPAVGGAEVDIAAGTVVALDGSSGELAVNPSKSTLTKFRSRQADLDERLSRAQTQAFEPAVTRDGVEILVGATIGSVEDARRAAENGADLAGLVRTEFLFLDRPTPPTIDEQAAIYQAIAETLGDRPLTIRTLDIGGDKSLPYVPQLLEANPFLGTRGLRYGLTFPTLLSDQLVAIARTALTHRVNVMFPMVTTVAEVTAARKLLDWAVARCGGRPQIGVGVMVEVPAAALRAAALAKYVDFVSIGTNDLTQYTMAAERGNAAVAHLSDNLDPAVLQLVKATCDGFRERKVAVCGELAVDNTAVPLMCALGIRAFTVRGTHIPLTKAAIRETHVATATDWLLDCVDMTDGSAVRARLDIFRSLV